jgi:signal transduction histidine kinase
VSDSLEAGAAAPSSRVLVAEGPSSLPLVEALRRQGETVVCADGLAGIEALLAREPAPDAIVLDLSGVAPAEAPAGRSSTRKSARPARPGAGETPRDATAPAAAPGPFVLALTADPAHSGGPEMISGVHVTVRVPAGDIERALRELRGALAQRRLAEVMEELERLRAAVMHARRTAHDLAQPLTTIMARAQILVGKLKPDDPHARPLGIICEESEKLASLIEQFQKLKSIAAGPGPRAD